MNTREVDIGRRALLGLRTEHRAPRALIGDACLNARGVICDACKDVCDVSAIVRLWTPNVRSPTRVALLAIDEDLCTGCGDCARVCPSDAIALSPEATGGQSPAAGQKPARMANSGSD